MRVVAGTYKGQRITAPKHAATRPTQDRVREALFSMLGSLSGLRVLDLFAGSGALGIEALSRGAQTATFVDADRSAASCIRENLEHLEITQAGIFKTDALSFLRGAARHADRWDLVFCDPPYRLAHRLAEPLGRLLRPVLADQARIVVESPHKNPLQLKLPLHTERTYGDTRIAIHGAGEENDG